jgi:two-component system alkaline phosphatase synthesis response regulator PhoP
MMKHLIYVTEDDENIRNLICVALESFGYTTRAFETAEEALEAVRGVEGSLPSLFVFDWMLPGMDGMAAVAKLKASPDTRKIPVMMLTAKDSELDVVAGLDGGADDYMTKPFGILEFSARIRNLLKRFGDEREEDKFLAVGDISIDLEKREVKNKGETVELTLKEYELLCYLMENTNRVVTREELLDRIWGYDYDGETRTLDMHIKTLRQKLKESGHNIKTIRGVGYRLS